MEIKKRGQMAIFIIVAIAIVAITLLIFFFRPQIIGIFEGEVSPERYIETCVRPEIKPAMEILSDQGSYQNPQGYVNFNGNKVQYLCYTDDFYEPCVVQQPMTKNNFEKELDLMLSSKVNNCFSKMQSEYRDRGYDISSVGIDSSVSIIPNKIILNINAPLSISKNQNTIRVQNFDIELESEMYDLLFIASSIVDYESKLGGSATELYLQYYPNLKIEKIKLSDGSTIYKLSNVITNERFNFASRSVAWPAGYGLEGSNEL